LKIFFKGKLRARQQANGDILLVNRSEKLMSTAGLVGVLLPRC
jgi:hypothetical protein